MRSLLLVLTVIRNADTRSMVRRTLEETGHRVIDASGYSQAQSLLGNGFIPDLLLIESVAANHIEAAKLRLFLRKAPGIATCRIVASSDRTSGKYHDVSVFAVRHFISKPVKRRELDSMIETVNRSPKASSSVEKSFTSLPISNPYTSGLARGMPGTPYLEELAEGGYFLAASPKMLEVQRQVKLIADADVNVLILGESGTGKEVIAHLIHKYSQRSRNRFLKVNCAALPADLLESELFGHQKGAFAGAVEDRPGKFEQANRGTLLDEIGEMSAQMQAKLLLVLQDGLFTRVGGQAVIKADLRVIAATNVHIESALKERKFREDLYYRLSVFTINIPPLRERREEIPYLIEEIIRRAHMEMENGRENGFSSRLMDVALSYEWPGNMRELRKFVTRAMIMRTRMRLQESWKLRSIRRGRPHVKRSLPLRQRTARA